MGICWSNKIKSASPSNTGFHSRSASRDGSSSKASSSSMPITPRSEGQEILQSCNLNSISFSELKNATRNFHPDSVLGEGGFGSVFKGWIDESTLRATKAGAGMVIAVKRLNPDGFQGHTKFAISPNLKRNMIINCKIYNAECIEEDNSWLHAINADEDRR